MERAEASRAHHHTRTEANSEREKRHTAQQTHNIIKPRHECSQHSNNGYIQRTPQCAAQEACCGALEVALEVALGNLGGTPLNLCTQVETHDWRSE